MHNYKKLFKKIATNTNYMKKYAKQNIFLFCECASRMCVCARVEYACVMTELFTGGSPSAYMRVTACMHDS